ncbi:MAG TPA: diguanylate cyclase [Methylibium sp.]|uniref:GGDEF domain-containing response regulator n=1 Tax=Methylibium sp. TaxID=2067992 RepID=UPI002DBE54BE|nr:diguanylate cyclase [Methylibium sp.]HEU4457985.1 diguanylate cyclase [Methylibium sp.]
MRLPEILLVDDDPASIRLLGRILEGLGSLRFATGGEEALRLAQAAPPDLVLLDGEMPGLSGFEVCTRLKADATLADVPVIFVTSHSGPDFEINGFAIGAADFIAKPVRAPLVIARVKAQLRAKQQADALRELSRTDGLTGLANRRLFDETLAREWPRARRAGTPIALLLIDVDHFKLYNDRHGHPAGDDCLRRIAHSLRTVLQRPADLAARYGGEEFVLLLPETPREGALRVAERLLAELRGLRLVHEAAPLGRVSASIGIGCHDAESDRRNDHATDFHLQAEFAAVAHSASLLVQAADLALYAAKRAGRARCALLDACDIDAPQRVRLFDAAG